MGHIHNIRSEKKCLNCGNRVKERYCGHCGQENVETKQSFHYLFTHFFEDFVHYDSSFWRTIKLLLFKPGELTNVYLSGKRKMYVPPVKLYIFISFVTFFFVSILPSSNAVQKTNNETANSRGIYSTDDKNIASMSQLEEELSKKTDLSTIEQIYYKKVIEADGWEKFNKKLSKKIIQTIPKTLFIYLPVFAFFLWLFHSKKKWWFFEHGIFTLHYFSFLLIVVLIIELLDRMNNRIDFSILNIVTYIITTVFSLYAFSYFFFAYYRVYQLTKKRTIANGVLFFILNIFLVLALLLATVFIAIQSLE